LHQEVGREAAAAGVSRLYLFGDMGREVRHGALEGGLSPGDILHGTKDEISRDIKRYMESLGCSGTGIYILVKGSRGMAMEEILNFLLHLTENKPAAQGQRNQED
ncbi:MAG: hypothetical protein HQK66_03990, partial [Desulfamplus sp.]|nr:hypothetical protein [Desulfamplus sp.]